MLQINKLIKSLLVQWNNSVPLGNDVKFYNAWKKKVESCTKAILGIEFSDVDSKVDDFWDFRYALFNFLTNGAVI